MCYCVMLEFYELCALTCMFASHHGSDVLTRQLALPRFHTWSRLRITDENSMSEKDDTPKYE